MAVWASNKVKSEILRYGNGFIFDSNRIGWSVDGKFSRNYPADSRRATTQKPDNSFIVDLDAEKGQTPRENHENKHRVAIKFAKKIQLATVRAYLDGKTDFDNGILEGISKASSSPAAQAQC